MKTAEIIDKILKERHMSRRQLAIKAGIPPSSLQSAMERNKNISFEMLHKIANTLQVDFISLVYDEEAEEKEWTEFVQKQIDFFTSSVIGNTIISCFCELNEFGQEEALERITDLMFLPQFSKDKKIIEENAEYIDDFLKKRYAAKYKGIDELIKSVSEQPSFESSSND